MTTNKYKTVEDIIVRRNNMTRNSLTGYKGVTKMIGKNIRYQASFSITDTPNRVKLHLGTYDTPEEAYIARTKFIDNLK